MSSTLKPRMFIASSVEGLDVAYSVQENLEYQIEPTVWDQGVFTPSAYTVDAIEDELDQSDFGAFVFSPDDAVVIRGEKYSAVRDNVIFELGLFLRGLGRERIFIIHPRGIADFRVPTDLVGVTPLTYDPHRRDGNLRAALGPACNAIRKAVKRLGAASGRPGATPPPPAPPSSPGPTTIVLSKEAIELLVNAAKDADGTVIVAETFEGLHLQTNKRDFCNTSDPRQEAVWKAAIEELKHHKLVDDDGAGEVYQITQRGYEAADEFATEEEPPAFPAPRAGGELKVRVRSLGPSISQGPPPNRQTTFRLQLLLVNETCHVVTITQANAYLETHDGHPFTMPMRAGIEIAPNKATATLEGQAGPFRAIEADTPKLGLVVLEAAQFDTPLRYRFDELVAAKFPKAVTGC